jgi:succinate dehydrogenase hydrophobic anchor subunit
MRLRSILSFFGLPIEDPVAWDSMIQRAHSSLWLAFYIILLALVLYHGLYGLRNILLELSLSPAAARRISTALIAVGLAAFIFGTYVPVKLFLS